MNDRIVMRQCCAADVDTLKKLWALCFSDDSRDDIDAFFARAYHQAVAFAGFDGDDAVVMLYLLPAHANGTDCRIPVWYLYAGGTHPAYRARGLYRELMQTAREWAIKSDKHAIYLHPANSSLYELYAALGYTRSLVSQTSIPATATRSITLDDYFGKRSHSTSNEILVWEPDDSIAEFFMKPTWHAGVDQNHLMCLYDGEVVIERLPLTVDASETNVTALWITTTDDEAICTQLESSLGYSLIYGD